LEDGGAAVDGGHFGGFGFDEAFGFEVDLALLAGDHFAGGLVIGDEFAGCFSEGGELALDLAFLCGGDGWFGHGVCFC